MSLYRPAYRWLPILARSQHNRIARAGGGTAIQSTTELDYTLNHWRVCDVDVLNDASGESYGIVSDLLQACLITDRPYIARF